MQARAITLALLARRDGGIVLPAGVRFSARGTGVAQVVNRQARRARIATIAQRCHPLAGETCFSFWRGLSIGGPFDGLLE